MPLSPACPAPFRGPTPAGAGAKFSLARTGHRAFSLLEVIIAVGLFASAVTAMVALLPALARRGAESGDLLAAQRLPDALHRELTRLAGSDLNALAGQIPEMVGPLPAGLAFVADRPARQLHSRDYLPPSNGALPEGDCYFLVECWRFPAEPLKYSASRACLALAVRVSWPYRQPGATAPTAQSARTELWFTAAINR